MLRQQLQWLGGPGLPEIVAASDQPLEEVVEEDEPVAECEEDVEMSEGDEDSP